MSTVEPPRPPTPSPLPPTSRYATTPVAAEIGDDGVEVRWFRRRFLPPPDELAVTHEHTVAGAERLDLIAAAELGDPELWWRLADANGAIRPSELTDRPGRRLRITLPHGIPGGGQ